MKALAVVAFALACSSCILNVLDVSDRLDERGGVILDTPKNRKNFIEGYERTLAQERQGVRPPPADESWDEVWASIFGALRSGKHENPEFYISYIKQRRKELGLPRR